MIIKLSNADVINEYVFLGDWNLVYSHRMLLINIFPTLTQSFAISSRLILDSYPPSLNLSIVWFDKDLYNLAWKPYQDLK